MSGLDDLNAPVELFKNGNSYALQVTKKDCELLDADTNTQFEKIISPDGQEIIFRKIKAARPNIIEIANDLFDEHMAMCSTFLTNTWP